MKLAAFINGAKRRVALKVLGASVIMFSLSSWCAAEPRHHGSGSPHPGAAMSSKQITHRIHSAIVEDESLPYCAHVVRVRCKDGEVQLEGKVLTEQQKTKIAEKAATIAGKANIVDRIVVVSQGSPDSNPIK